MLARTNDEITIAALTKALEATALEQQVVASNIANVETPGYCARTVHFVDHLRRAMQAAPDRRAAAIAQVVPEVGADRTTPVRADGNNVQLEHELTNLMKASLHYRTLARLLNKQMQMIERAINGGTGR